MTQSFRALTLDFGGTLDGRDHWRERFWRLYHDAGIEPPRAEFAAAFGDATRAAYGEESLRTAGLEGLVRYHVEQQMHALGLPVEQAAERIVRDFVRETRAALRACAALLLRWRQRFRLGVISNFYGNLPVILAEEGLAPLFHVVIDSGLVGTRKPERGIFELAWRALGCSPPEVLHVGDSLEHDVYGACAAGMYAAWLRGAAEDPGQQLPEMAICVATLGELDEYLSCKAQ